MNGKLVPILLGLAMSALIACAVWAVSRRPTTLDGLDRLIESGRFDEAEDQLDAYIRAHPDEVEPRLRMAELQVDRTDAPKPALALEQLAGLDSGTHAHRARVQLARGKALFHQKRLREAEAAWRQTLQLDPRLTQAAWGLLHLMALQDRPEDAGALVLSIIDHVPRVQERAALLLQLLRVEAHPVAPELVDEQLRPAIQRDPNDIASSRALSLTLVRTSRRDEAFSIIRECLARNDQSPAAWAALMEVLDEAGEQSELIDTLGRLPAALASDPIFDPFRARVAQLRGDWPTAAECYGRASRAHPTRIELAYRYSRALASLGRDEEAAPIRAAVDAARVARLRVRELYDRAYSQPDFGLVPQPELYQSLADLVETLRRPGEARAWRALLPAE